MSSPCAYIRRILQSLGASLIARLCIRLASRVRSTTSRKKTRVNLETALLVFGYSPRHFTYLDPRIEAHLKKHFIPSRENVLAFLRADMITKDTSKSNVKFPGILIFTSEQMYILKIANEELGRVRRKIAFTKVLYGIGGSSDLNKWLEKYENVRLENVKSMEAVCFNQGISVTCKNQSDDSSGRDSYLVVLHERRRTANFLSFMKKSEILPSEKVNDTPNPEVPTLPQLGENIEYFLVSEVIVIYQNLEEWKRFSLPGFAFTKTKLLILQYSEVEDEKSDKYETDIIIEYERKIVDLISAADKKALLTLQFNDKENSISEMWYIKTGIGMTHRIIAQLNDIWHCYH